MTIEEILTSLDELLDSSWSLPLSGGRCVVDAERVRDLIDDMRVNLPQEIRQARSIVSERAEILANAKREGEAVIRRAEERAKAMVAKEEIIKAAQTKSADLLSQTQVKSREIRHAANDFSDGVLRATEEAMVKALTELRATRQALKSNRQK